MMIVVVVGQLLHITYFLFKFDINEKGKGENSLKWVGAQQFHVYKM